MSDVDYEDLIAEVRYEGECCFVMSQEDGFQNLKIELHARGNGQPWTFRVADFEEAVKDAKQELWRLRRTSE